MCNQNRPSFKLFSADMPLHRLGSNELTSAQRILIATCTQLRHAPYTPYDEACRFYLVSGNITFLS